MKMVRNNIRLKRITKYDCPFLYELLTQRTSKMNISHKKMPTYDKHIKFVMSKPYTKWYIILFKDEEVGSIYLSKQNEIGIFLKKEIHRKGIGGKALKILIKFNPRRRYLANI